MKLIIVILLSIFLTLKIFGQSDPSVVKLSHQFIENQKSSSSVLDFYRQYSSFTDPGEYEYLYEELPDSLPELCHLIKSQFIHPYAELPNCREQIPKERWNESFKFSTVKSILEGLIKYDSKGITKNRKIEDRLILGCRDYALLLSSILKYRGIPTRMRAGHATYLIPDFHTSHVICEVWNKKENRWMLVDPSTAMVDFNREKFDFSNELWIEFQKGKIDPKLYGIPRRYSGAVSIVAKVCMDVAYLLQSEYPVFKYPPIIEYAMKNNNKLTTEHSNTLNKISNVMNEINFENLFKLHQIYLDTHQIQITKSFNLAAKGSKSRIKN